MKKAILVFIFSFNAFSSNINSLKNNGYYLKAEKEVKGREAHNVALLSSLGIGAVTGLLANGGKENKIANGLLFALIAYPLTFYATKFMKTPSDIEVLNEAKRLEMKEKYNDLVSSGFLE